jgi:uracil-DNA glycosylase
MALPALPPSWSAVLAPEIAAPYFGELQAFLARERETGTVHPPEEMVLAAFEHTPLDRVKVLVLGQDPYPGAGQAHGLAFSVLPGVRPPPSLANVFKELHDDLGCRVPDNGTLVPWADQGVLLLNAVLTVRAGAPGSHQGKGWERFTDAAIRAVAAREEPAVFLLWGSYARKKAKLIDPRRHRVFEGVHPSPLSARSGFFGSRPFSKVNAALAAMGGAPIDWQLPDLGQGKTPVRARAR